MLSEMTSEQLSEWMAYYTLEPWGEERADLRMGILASVDANIHKSTKRKKPYKPEDFMPTFEEPDEAEMQARMLAKARAILGGRR